jgi:hypothetical protein
MQSNKRLIAMRSLKRVAHVLKKHGLETVRVP